MSAAAWMQVVLLSGFKWEVAVRALHKAVHRAYQTSPHVIAATVKCLYSVKRHMPACRRVVVSRVGAGLQKNAYWQGGSYSSWKLPADLAVQNVNGAWNNDFCCIETIRNSSCRADHDSCQQQNNVCVWPTGDGVLLRIVICSFSHSAPPPPQPH